MKEKCIAIMQPYIFPYIGYFQMIQAVDVFVFYDDVNFIKGGWINRNRILINQEASYLTIPCKGISSNKKINEIEVNRELKDFSNIIKKIEQSYKKAPHFQQIFALLESILKKEILTISDLAISSVIEISKYLKINTEFKISSETYNNGHLNRTDRLINICKIEKATHYINAIGGKDLYSKEEFKEHGIELSFIKSRDIRYKQFNEDFIPWLSIIDVLMFNEPQIIREMLLNYELN